VRTLQKKIIGIIGYIGTGKSTAVKMLTNEQTTVIFADKLARELTRADQPLATAIDAAFPDCRSRSDLAHFIFTDSTAREQLHRLLHPPLQSALRQAIISTSEGRVLVEGANLFLLVPEAIDVWLEITAPPELALHRAGQHLAWSQDTLHACLTYQRTMPRPENVITIDNSGSQNDFQRKIELF